MIGFGKDAKREFVRDTLKLDGNLHIVKECICYTIVDILKMILIKWQMMEKPYLKQINGQPARKDMSVQDSCLFSSHYSLL